MANFPVEIPPLELYRGDSFSQTFVIKNGSTGAVRDLIAEGWGSWSAQWRPFIGSSTSVSFTIDTSAAASGRIGISLSASQTQSMRRGVWDLQSSQGPVVRTWLAGSVDFAEDVTHG